MEIKTRSLASCTRRNGPEKPHQAYLEHSWVQSSYHTLVSISITRPFKHSSTHSQRLWALLRAFRGWPLLSRIKLPFWHQSSILLLQHWAQKGKQKFKNSTSYWILPTGLHFKFTFLVSEMIRHLAFAKSRSPGQRNCWSPSREWMDIQSSLYDSKCWSPSCWPS